MQPYAQPLPVPVMMSLPIQFGIMQENMNNPISSKMQYKHIHEAYQKQNAYQPICGQDQFKSIQASNCTSAIQNNNYSSANKNNDPSVMIIDCPASSSSSIVIQSVKRQTPQNSKVKRKSLKKIVEKKEKSNKETQMLSSTSLGDRIARSHQEKLTRKQSEEPKQEQINTSTPQQRNTRQKQDVNKNKIDQNQNHNTPQINTNETQNSKYLTAASIIRGYNKNNETKEPIKVLKGKQLKESPQIQSPNKQQQGQNVSQISRHENKQVNTIITIEESSSRISENIICSEDRNKRTRKHNSRYNNEDYISSEYMHIMKYATNKRSNPALDAPSLKKKIKTIDDKQKKTSSLIELVNQHNLFDQSNISKSKKLFAQSVKQTEITRSDNKAAKNVFTLQLSKQNPKQKSIDKTQQYSAYFLKNRNQNLIEEQFEEDTIVLVNNNNQNVEIKVKRTPLDKSESIAQKKVNKDNQIMNPLRKIRNRFDESSRHKYFSQIQFIKDYKSGYAPIDIQNQQEKELDEMQKNEQQGEETHKQHFIRRKQTQNINLKRSCGVSYVKQPESKQENVSQIYERLPQLVFQCSNGQPKLFEHENLYEKLYQKLFNSQNQWLLCTYFESEDENLMRDYLLYPEDRWEISNGKYFVVKSVNDIWPLIFEKYFLCIHLFYDPKELIKCPQLKEFTVEEVKNIIKYSNIHLGLLFKKSINGKKAFKKSLGQAFLGDIENHPSSQTQKKKGSKINNINGDEQTQDESQNKINEDDRNKQSSSTQQNDSIFANFHMNKTQVNKYFKEVKSKLKQEKFLSEMPIYKKKIEEIQQYLLPNMKKVNKNDNNKKQDTDNFSDFDSDDEKVDALLEIIDQISEQINDEDYKIPKLKETRQKIQTRKESSKINKNKQNSTEQNEQHAQKSQNDHEDIEIEQEKPKEEIENQTNIKNKDQTNLTNSEQEVQIEIEENTDDNQNNQNHEKDKNMMKQTSQHNIDIKENIQIEQHQSSNMEDIENQQSSQNSPSLQAQKSQTTDMHQINNISQVHTDVNQIAQTIEKIDQPLSPVFENTSSGDNKYLNSPSQEINAIREIERVNTSDSTAITVEENTPPIILKTENNQEIQNQQDNQKEAAKQKSQSLNPKFERKESIICKEVLEYLDRDLSSKNINTLSTKLELYVEEKGWKLSSQLVKSLLSTFILYAKDQFEKLALEMMNIRFSIVREENESKLTESLKNIRVITKNSSKRKPVYENYTQLTKGKWEFQENNLKNENIVNNLTVKKDTNVNEGKLISETESLTIGKLLDKEENYSVLNRGDFSMPLYYISTRDSFAFDLIEKTTACSYNGKKFNKIEYFFDKENYPTNFKSFIDSFPDYRVGTTLYTGFFTHKELLSIEDSTYETEVKSFQRHYFPMTAQMTCTAQKIRRTKFFFGSRYIWTRQQLSEPHSFVGAGVRQDVSEPPAWMRRKVVTPLEQAGILPDGFINSLALNVYHDGKEGLAQHFDDATRFRQPIFTFKLFSDARLSFGSQLYGFCNSAFVIPMPRGSILKLEENSYAANGIKHCVRPCDMAGKNATIIMRQMHHKVVNEANIYDEQVDLPTWISTLSSREDSVPYGDQKQIEAEFLLKNCSQNSS